ncbi:cell division protein FtsZ [Polaribacter irgensii 23-P]|uniref:Cell division protein FtsZ n=1 Tax=Polaribacter irgensii 23-P TaxID=313594 RepID=A4BVX5_9FLAO|nr:cell division protein FtsZ [Polaribacter irgensii 23-P]
MKTEHFLINKNDLSGVSFLFLEHRDKKLIIKPNNLQILVGRLSFLLLFNLIVYYFFESSNCAVVRLVSLIKKDAN